MIYREPIDILKFIAMEHEQVLVSFANGSDDLKLINHLQGLYAAPMTNATVDENDYVVVQLLTFTHYHFLYALASHMRCHLSEAFASARAAIDAALIAAQIIHDRESQVAYLNRTKPFDKLNRHYKNLIRDNRPLPHALVPQLIKHHDAFSSFAIHADVNSFVHRVTKVGGAEPMMAVQYFQFAKNAAERRIHCLTLLHTFVMVLDVFADFLVDEVKLVPAQWRDELHGLGGKIERLNDELKKQIPAEGVTGTQ
ncbi:hypothetical protein [Bradyrhizobium sp. SZCCHNS2005]|uniref:hypothetical protein n=1 Tax=Bradyrhizobium sp. SZCCHNS2005 TaxID=3057303 RepID=UPI0028E917C5|nr:hypothetical protein [Bradyrhizobium sp. SZCCHNS2005]